MLCKMQGAVGDSSFHPRYEDSRTIYELFKLLVPPTINQNKSWVSSLNVHVPTVLYLGGGTEREGGRERDWWYQGDRIILATLIYKTLILLSQISPGVGQLLQSFVDLIQHPSSVFKMAEIARTLGEKRMCRMEVDYLGLEVLDIFCVEHELVLTALTSIQSMVSKKKF